MRIGEVVALKWSDIDYVSKTIHIHRMETLAEKENGSLQDFIFCDAEGRTKIREIDNRIRKLCKKADIEVKNQYMTSGEQWHQA